MIKIENLCKKYGELSVLENINTEIHKGDVVSIIGPSGCGKSTFIRCLNLLEQPTSGKIFIDGEDILDKNADVCKLRQKMGMVFQSFNLFPHFSVLKNITDAPVRVLKVDPAAARENALSLLAKMNLSDRAESYPCELSGGQQQRVAIARALALSPTILCFDEPTSALDPELTGEVLKVIRNLKNDKRTMIVVTHEMAFARNVSDKVIFMADGVVEEMGTPEEVFDHPKSEKVKAFLGRSQENALGL